MKVLVATDGSERAMKAVHKSLEMAEREGAEVTLLTVAYYFRSETDEMPPNIPEFLDSGAALQLKKLNHSLIKKVSK